MIRKIVEDIERLHGFNLSPEGSGELAKGVYLGTEEYDMLLADAEINNYTTVNSESGMIEIQGIPVYRINTFHHYNVG